MYVISCQSSREIALQLKKHVALKLIQAETKIFTCGEMLVTYKHNYNLNQEKI